MLGGAISSTNVAFSFSRKRVDDRSQIPLAVGVVAASTMLYIRVAAAAMVLNASLARALVPLLIPPLAAGGLFCLLGLRRSPAGEETVEPSNPLQFHSALQMAGLFQLVLFAVHATRDKWGQTGLLVTGAILGLTDVDALTISMAKAAADPDVLRTAALATATGITANKVVKMGAVLIFGRGRFRLAAAAGLLVLAVATAGAMFFFA